MDNQIIKNPVTINTSASSSSSHTLSGSAFSAAHQRRLSEIRAVPEEQLAPFTLDLAAAVMTVRGALPKILEHREGMSKLIGLEQLLIDGLEDYALAAGEANTVYDVAVAPREDIAELNAEALRLREQFRGDALTLANRGLIDRGRLAQFTGFVGYKNVAVELMDYVTLLWEEWPRIEGRTAVTKDELERAKQFAEHLMLVIGLREQAPVVAADAARVRHQALTLLVRSYDEVRRALWYLRWKEGDVEAIAPTLYARPRKRHEPEGPEAPGPVASTAAPAVTHPAPAVVEPGMPGGSPFIS